MTIVARVAGRDLTRPVERQAHRLQLTLHRGDVGVSPIARIDLVVARRVLGRQAEGVPSHWVKDIVAIGAAIARDNVAHRVVADVPHMDTPRGIREHLEHIIFRARIVVLRLEELCLIPGFLPFGFGRARIVSFSCHARYFAYEECWRRSPWFAGPVNTGSPDLPAK